MRTHTHVTLTVSIVCLLALAGCGDSPKSAGVRSQRSDAPSAVPAHVAGTVAEYARLVDAGYLPVEGYGLVVGLGEEGSSEVPAGVEKYLTKELSRVFGRPTQGTGHITPRRILDDLDTAAVRVSGVIRPAAPIGEVFDVYVEALPHTQTRSLAGGTLWPCDLFLSVPGGDPSRVQVKKWATASGSVFLNPYLDHQDPAEQARLRAGRVIGGGKVTKNRQIKLQMLQPDYSRCDLIQERINLRFGGRPRRPARRERIANATSSSAISLRIPPSHRDRYEYFLDLVLHLPLRANAEAQARRVAEQMRQPGADHEELALIFEAMGKEVLPILSTLYGADDPAAAFYAARAGLRMGDTGPALEVVLAAARHGDASYQLKAVQELGRHRRILRARQVLRELIDCDNERVRAAAYEGLIHHNDTTTIQRTDVADRFDMDVIRSSREYVIYATQSDTQRIALFGSNMRLNRPVFFTMADDLVTIDAPADSEQVRVFRKVPRSGGYSDTLTVDCDIPCLVRTLGDTPERDLESGSFKGLGLTYSQVVRVLLTLCERGDIPARFVLQQGDRVDRRGRPGRVGRPDIR
jgi:flagellar basal body P-ring protein FlgI